MPTTTVSSKLLTFLRHTALHYTPPAPARSDHTYIESPLCLLSSSKTSVNATISLHQAPLPSPTQSPLPYVVGNAKGPVFAHLARQDRTTHLSRFRSGELPGFSALWSLGAFILLSRQGRSTTTRSCSFVFLAHHEYFAPSSNLFIKPGHREDIQRYYRVYNNKQR